MGLAKIETNLDDAQIQSLMHQLRHECDPNFAAQWRPPRWCATGPVTGEASCRAATA